MVANGRLHKIEQTVAIDFAMADQSFRLCASGLHGFGISRAESFLAYSEGNCDIVLRTRYGKYFFGREYER